MFENSIFAIPIGCRNHTSPVWFSEFIKRIIIKLDVSRSFNREAKPHDSGINRGVWYFEKLATGKKVVQAFCSNS